MNMMILVAELASMAQHFLLSAAARTVSLKVIFSAGEEASYRRFCRLHWPETDGAAVCPACGCADVYDLATRRRFKCAAMPAGDSSCMMANSEVATTVMRQVPIAVVLTDNRDHGCIKVVLEAVRCFPDRCRTPLPVLGIPTRARTARIAR